MRRRKKKVGEGNKEKQKGEEKRMLRKRKK